jgi:hypothetical protein
VRGVPVAIFAAFAGSKRKGPGNVPGPCRGSRVGWFDVRGFEPNRPTREPPNLRTLLCDATLSHERNSHDTG